MTLNSEGMTEAEVARDVAGFDLGVHGKPLPDGDATDKIKREGWERGFACFKLKNPQH